MSVSLENFKNNDLNSWLLKLLDREPKISSINIYIFEKPAKLQMRVSATAENKRIISDTLDRKKKTNIPFWELFLSQLMREHNLNDEMLDAVMFHNGYGKLHSELSLAQIKNGYFKKLLNEKKENRILSIGSRVTLLDGSQAHIPMIDFCCSVGKKEVTIVNAICQRIFDCRFTIFISGNSFHAYGDLLQSAEDRIKFLANSLLFSPITDKNYIAHQLLQEFSTLRISGISK